MSNQIIPISQSLIGSEKIQTVDARELHAWLDVQTPFHKWIQRRIEEWGFTQDIDFIVMDNFVQNPQGGRPSTKYLISLDMAKELSMVERTARGKEARQYFIAC